MKWRIQKWKIHQQHSTIHSNEVQVRKVRCWSMWHLWFSCVVLSFVDTSMELQLDQKANHSSAFDKVVWFSKALLLLLDLLLLVDKTPSSKIFCRKLLILLWLLKILKHGTARRTKRSMLIFFVLHPAAAPVSGLGELRLLAAIMLRGRRAEPLNEGAQRSNSAEMAVINPKLTLELNHTSQITNSLCSVNCISKSLCWFTNPAK